MAEAILYNLASSIIMSLGSSAFNEITNLFRIKTNLHKLKRRVSAIQAVLLDAEDHYYSSSHQVKDWVDKVQDAMEDADNLLDALNTQVLRQQAIEFEGNRFIKKVRVFFSNKNDVVFGFRTARKIKAILERLDDIKSLRDFHLDERLRDRAGVMFRQQRSMETHSSTPHIVVGREEDKETIVEFLLMASNRDDENVSVISICGMGGLGKTTLAQLVFNDEIIKREFELRIWICVSDDFDVELIAKNIVLDVMKSDAHIRDLHMNAIKDQLQQKINGKKYLLVLDDIWIENPNKWNKLKDLLIGGARGSKIIVTTRSERIAKMTQTLASYEVKGLSVEESWDLFTKVAFRSGEGPQSITQEAIGKEILAKCKGVPLAIQTIGGALYYKETESEWLSFRDTELWEVEQDETDIMPTLRLSYNQLPLHLKHCFAFCSLYPKDHVLGVKELVNLWMAQGYIICEDSSQCIEVGLKYFEELFRRSFFQEVEVDQLGNLCTCKMHDLMHDLAQLMSGLECVLLNFKNKSRLSEKTRHVNIDDNHAESLVCIPPSTLKKNKIRTLLLSYTISGNDKRCLEFVANSRYLRALDMSYADIKPDFIPKLKHLRYLNLSGNRSIEMLPRSIAELQNLQTININECKSLKKLPKDITKLVNLCQLYLDGCDSLTQMPRGIGRLTALQVLSTFVVSESSDGAGLHELRDLNNLRGSLTITNLEKVRNPEEGTAANLEAKQHLQSLELKWNRGSRREDADDESREERDRTCLEELRPHTYLRSLRVEGYEGADLPNWLSTLTSLVKLHIVDCGNCQYIPPLDQFTSLKVLRIKEMPKLEYIEMGDGICLDSNLCEEPLFYACLESIRLKNCPKLKGWWRRSSTPNQDYFFPCLAILLDLEMRECPNLTTQMPPFTSLALLNVFRGNSKEIEMMLKSPSTSSIVSTLPSQVNALSVNEINDDVQVLPEEMLRQFTSLKALFISECPKLKSVSQALHHLTSLKRLQILCCEELDISDVEGHSLKNLISLTILNIPKLVAIPDGLQHATSLQNLRIRNCSNLKCLPEWIRTLTTLRNLDIKDCNSELSERCKNNTAKDWHLISHIPNIYIDYVFVQQNGCYRL